MPAKENEAKILSSILPNEPTVKVDLSLIPDAAASTQIRVNMQALKSALGLPVLTPERAATFVAVSRADDTAYYAAYTRALQRRPELAERTISPDFLGRLSVTGARVSALDMGASELGEKLLLCALDLGQSISERADLLEEVLARPDDHIITGNITVGRARLLFSEFIKVCEDQQRQTETRQDKVERTRVRAGATAEEASQQLDDLQRADRLRARAELGQPPPAPRKEKPRQRSKQP